MGFSRLFTASQNYVRFLTIFWPNRGTVNAASRLESRKRMGKSVQSRRERYLAAAESCIRLAGQMSDPARKSVLIDLAATWMRLADQADRNAATDVVYEPPFGVPADEPNSTTTEH